MKQNPNPNRWKDLQHSPCYLWLSARHSLAWCLIVTYSLQCLIVTYSLWCLTVTYSLWCLIVTYSLVFDSDLHYVVFDYDRDTLSSKNHKSDSKHDSRSYYLKKIRNCIFLLQIVSNVFQRGIPSLYPMFTLLNFKTLHSKAKQ